MKIQIRGYMLLVDPFVKTPTKYKNFMFFSRGLEVKQHGVSTGRPCDMVEEGLGQLMELLRTIQHELRHFGGRKVEDQDVRISIGQLRDFTSLRWGENAAVWGILEGGRLEGA